MVSIDQIKEMSTEELERLIEYVKSELRQRMNGNKEYEFSFKATTNPRKGKPYVARLWWEDGKVIREFFNLDRTMGRNTITVAGKYTARQGDIIEKREDASWNKDYRYWYLVSDEGKEIKVADIGSSARKSWVTKYLKSEIPAQELVERVG